jgi:hypothetical protein
VACRLLIYLHKALLIKYAWFHISNPKKYLSEVSIFDKESLMKSIFHAFLVIAVCSILMIFNQHPAALNHACECLVCALSGIANYTIGFCDNNSSEIYLITLTIFGSLLVPIFSPSGTSERTSVPFLRRIFPKRSLAFYNRLDLFITVLVGTLLGYLIIHPTAPLEAIGSGAGWSTLLNKICKIWPKSINDSGPNDTSGPHAVP